MKRVISILGLMVGIEAIALGPIPNGQYVGTEKCTGYPVSQSTIVLTDNTLGWDGQQNAFTIDANGFFTMNSVSGLTGNGLGHFTVNGLHYEVVFNFPKGATTVPVPGEDTFTFKRGKIYLTSSASGTSGTVTCTGVFKKTN